MLTDTLHLHCSRSNFHQMLKMVVNHTKLATSVSCLTHDDDVFSFLLFIPQRGTSSLFTFLRGTHLLCLHSSEGHIFLVYILQRATSSKFTFPRGPHHLSLHSSEGHIFFVYIPLRATSSLFTFFRGPHLLSLHSSEGHIISVYIPRRAAKTNNNHFMPFRSYTSSMMFSLSFCPLLSVSS